jgi:nucleoside permease NupC
MKFGDRFKKRKTSKHLLSASVMSAPAALAMAKLSYPETKVSIAMGKDVYNMEKG